MTIVLAAAAAVLFACGTYLLLQRELTRLVLGLALLAHGANLFILLGAGGRGEPTFVGGDTDAGFLDPLPQAFILTAIVITFGVTTFLLGLSYRSWVLTHDDVVQDDVEDRRVATLSPLTDEEADIAEVEAERAAAEREVAAHEAGARRDAVRDAGREGDRQEDREEGREEGGR